MKLAQALPLLAALAGGARADAPLDAAPAAAASSADPMHTLKEQLFSQVGRGPVVAVELDAAGRFDAAIGFVEVAAPLDTVWTVVTDFGRYRDFLPKLLESKVQGRTAEPRVVFEVESPGLNTRYVVQYRLDPLTHAVDGKRVGGDLEGSTWRWELGALDPGRTWVRYASRARNFSRVIALLEDEAQTVTAGINVGGVVTLLRAIKARSEAVRAAPGLPQAR